VSELLKNGELHPIANVAEKVAGKRPSRPCIWRWLRKGVRGEVLDGINVNGSWHTTEAAFRDFLARKSAAMLLPRETVPPASDDDLRAAGLL
jgi:hypothetical protein